MNITEMVASNWTGKQIATEVLKRLEEQGVRSVDTEGVCSYEGTDGNACAVGLIVDEENRAKYDSLVGGSSIYSVVSSVFKEQKEVKALALHTDMLGSLQNLHDAKYYDPLMVADVSAVCDVDLGIVQRVHNKLLESV